MGSRLDSDAMIAIRRLRRHLNVWRLLTVVAAAFAFYVTFADGAVLGANPHVARVQVEGVIVGDRDELALLDEIADDAAAQALIVDIASPGGTFDGGEAMYNALRRVANQKPVVVVMGGIATSGAYMTAIAADRIFASYGTVTGSIGVIMQSADVTGLLDKVGIKPETIKSGPLKATPNPAETLTEDARAQLQSVVDALHMRFLEMVAERRGVSVPTLRARTGDGRIMAGAEAVEQGLVDELGGYTDARAWLEREHEIATSLPVVDRAVEDPLAWWRQGADAAINAVFGKSLLSERLRLDGVLALWQPFQSGNP